MAGLPNGGGACRCGSRQRRAAAAVPAAGRVGRGRGSGAARSRRTGGGRAWGQVRAGKLLGVCPPGLPRACEPTLQPSLLPGANHAPPTRAAGAPGRWNASSAPAPGPKRCSACRASAATPRCSGPRTKRCRSRSTQTSAALVRGRAGAGGGGRGLCVQLHRRCVSVGKQAKSVCTPPYLSSAFPTRAAVGASDAMSIVSDCFSMLTAAAASGSQAVKAVPAFMRTGASRSNLAAAAGESGGGSGGGGGSQASQRPPSPQPPPQQQQQGQHIRHASVDSLPGGLADPAAWAGAEQAQQAAHLQAGQPAPSRSSSGGVEAPPVGRPHSGSSDGWNPLGQLSSEEREAAAAAAANWERTNGGWPAAATRSRSSSAASLAGSAQGQAQMHAHTNGSSSSLASPGSSQHGGAQYPGSQHGSQHGGAAFPAAAGEAAADPPPAGPPRPSSAGAGGSAAPPRPSSAGAAPRPKPAGAVLRITLKVRPA